MGANTLNYVRIKGNHLHLIMEIMISIIEIHTSIYIYMYAIPEAWDMCIGSERG